MPEPQQEDLAMRTLLIAAATIAFAGCTWVEPDSQGKQVRVAYGKDLGGCTEKGSVTVTLPGGTRKLLTESAKIRRGERA